MLQQVHRHGFSLVAGKRRGKCHEQRNIVKLADTILDMLKYAFRVGIFAFDLPKIGKVTVGHVAGIGVLYIYSCIHGQSKST
jgi:hypothetical protein